MADSIVHIGENSPEQVAFKLMVVIAGVEGQPIPGHAIGNNRTDRKWILSTYAECLRVVRTDAYSRE